MVIEIVLIVVLMLGIFIYSGTVNTKTFFSEEAPYLSSLKEKDYDFYVAAKFGENVNPNTLFVKRLQNTLYGGLILFAIIFTKLSFVNAIALIVFIYVLYKYPYMNLKGYYKKYMHKIDQLLPYYLKSLEILCQNYTVPVALSVSINDAPDIFKPGLREMVGRIDAGDSTIQPYMDFAIRYPVRDSMRMMRLLYRLSLGAQANKYQQLLIFSKSVSSLQNKAREVKYKNRLANMEKRTMIMLVVTGGGTMVILLLSMLMMFGG